MKIVLCGYMGSGKTSVGFRLSKTLSVPYFDLDKYISNAESRSISAVFLEFGEIYFRKLESKALKDVLIFEGDGVVALGGGTPCYGDNLSFILNQTDVKLIYLKASISTIVNRISSKNNSRPLLMHLNSAADKREFIAKHLFERRFFYEQAHHTINVDNRSLEEVVEDCLALL